MGGYTRDKHIKIVCRSTLFSLAIQEGQLILWSPSLVYRLTASPLTSIIIVDNTWASDKCKCTGLHIYRPSGLDSAYFQRIFFGAAASIWFEIWGSWIQVKKFRFSRKISEKFRFFTGNFTNKKSIFQGKFQKNFDFFQAISQKNWFSGQISEKF